jgi:hypothetical protein
VKIEKNSSFGFLVFHINIIKNDNFVNFSFVFIYFGLKIKLLWKNFFLKIQNGGKFIMKDDIFQKI